MSQIPMETKAEFAGPHSYPGNRVAVKTPDVTSKPTTQVPSLSDLHLNLRRWDQMDCRSR